MEIAGFLFLSTKTHEEARRLKVGQVFQPAPVLKGRFSHLPELSYQHEIWAGWKTCPTSFVPLRVPSWMLLLTSDFLSEQVQWVPPAQNRKYESKNTVRHPARV